MRGSGTGAGTRNNPGVRAGGWGNPVRRRGAHHWQGTRKTRHILGCRQLPGTRARPRHAGPTVYVAVAVAPTPTPRSAARVAAPAARPPARGGCAGPAGPLPSVYAAPPPADGPPPSMCASAARSRGSAMSGTASTAPARSSSSGARLEAMPTVTSPCAPRTRTDGGPGSR